MNNLLHTGALLLTLAFAAAAGPSTLVDTAAARRAMAMPVRAADTAKARVPATPAAKPAAAAAATGPKPAAAPSPVPAGFDTLAGPMPKTVYADKGPYVVVADVIVPVGQTCIIEPGAVLLFRSFTGLRVQGTLLARGADNKPIVFTSVNDRKYNPAGTLAAAPYDWNGIQVFSDGIGTQFSYCAVLYSVYGIVSMTRYIRIGPSVFRNNGRANVTIEGQEYQVSDTPFEYALPAAAPGSVAALALLPDPGARRRAIMRYSGLGGVLLGCVLGVVYTVQFAAASDELESLSSTSSGNLASHTGKQWEDSYSQARSDRAGMVLGYVIAAAGGVAVTWSFTF